MNAPPREIPIIDLFTGLPWVAEPESEPPTEAAGAAEANEVDRSRRERRATDTSGPQIAPHRQRDAAAIDLADAREERRCRCNRDHSLRQRVTRPSLERGVIEQDLNADAASFRAAPPLPCQT